ncbi:hypothetical protein L1987_00240 [Smallanthus sonchifolius]|uniref:Uncharacterized protein n=1 Tax=Smallanthus sonchifolius TaxID=185202 RepID=A0ACB9K1W4_9ASTR|nr:hypothetical protein L1987_00240 [Smallanthus sonchifolius]
MASSSVSLHFLPLPSSKTLSVISQIIFPASLRIFPSSIHTPSKLYEATPSSQFVTKVAVSPDLSSSVDEELVLDFSPELKLFVGNLPFHVDNAALALLFEQSGHVETAEGLRCFVF